MMQETLHALFKERPLGNKTSQDIPQISGFGFAAWDFISTIY